MSSDRSIEELNRAVRDCLQQCYLSQIRLDSFFAFIAKLKSDRWPEPEIEAIETAYPHGRRPRGIGPAMSSQCRSLVELDWKLIVLMRLDLKFQARCLKSTEFRRKRHT